ncbi:hypothetical protein HAT86_16725 [Roseovarius gahaiensis]|uniref:Curli production assembly/transport component CsgG n=1 Tax=Roseovarius gahaiensis TaxID=2716691 RepID=A0A967EG44_9RHOB|nr:hypothetical protein [Roseovarius gahaiensis]NHQ76083.1 hypothetical protein [Roseovarius gahaiensis]
MSTEDDGVIGAIFHGARAVLLGVVFTFSLLPPAQAQSVDEAILRLSLMLSREIGCAVSDPIFNVAAVPAKDASQTLDAQILTRIEGVILDAVRRESLDCVRITEVARAFDTLAFVQNLGRWDELGMEQRAKVASELSNADATITIVLSRAGEAYTASVSLVELDTGRTLASTRAEIPEELTASRCGASAAAEASGLATLAASLVARVPNADVLYVDQATYQDSFDPLGYGSYIADQFIAALSQDEGNVITGASLTVRRLTDLGEASLGPNDHTIMLRYWPCNDLSAVRLNVIATSGQGDVITIGQDLSLAALPADLVIVPPFATEVPGTKTPTAEGAGKPEPDLGFIFIEPRLISVGRLLTISVEPPADCNPFFFDISSSGRLTPIPTNIFEITEIRPGLLRYDNNSSSKYGIIVQAEDEPGLHRLGFVCQPSGLRQDDIRDVLRQLRQEHGESTGGVISIEGWDIVYNTMTYEILR